MGRVAKVRRNARDSSCSTNPQAVAALIKRSAKPRSWLIFFAHDVADDPSSYGCTPALFESALKSANDAGCRVLPMRDAPGFIRFRDKVSNAGP